MNADYVRDIIRFAPAGRLLDQNGNAFNLSHSEDLDPAEVRTDGRGNVVSSPLIWRKPCFGRLERYVRAHTGFDVWTDESGQRKPSPTPCDTCAGLSPGVHRACGIVVSERCQSNPTIEATFDAWETACGDYFGPRCFIGHRFVLWQAFLQSIIDHGGWTNVNDDQVKLEHLRRKLDEKERRKIAAKLGRKRQRDARRSVPIAITADYLQALLTERDRRAAKVKSLRPLAGQTKQSMLWLINLKDEYCDRIADVWSARELLIRCGKRVTGKAIAAQMIGNNRDYGLKIGSLAARVYDDLKRIAKLEDDSASAPLWAPWTYKHVPGTP